MSAKFLPSSRFLLVLVIPLIVAPAFAKELSAEKQAVESFKKAMKNRASRPRIQAVNELAAVEGKSISKLLRKVVGSDKSEHVRAAAAQALGKRGDRKDFGFLMGTLSRLKKLPIALAGSIDGIAEYGDPRSAEKLFDTGRYWMAKHKYPAMAAIRALGKIRDKESVDLLLKLYDCTYPGPGHMRDQSLPPTGMGPTNDETSATLAEYRPFIERSLQRLTGESIGDREAWKDWWEDEKRGFDLAKITDDVNLTLILTDDELAYTITRPNAGWKWVDAAEQGYTRTARMEADGQVQATLSILAYSTELRTPDRAEAMLYRQKRALLEKLEDVSEQKWDEAVEVGGVAAIRQTVAGTLDGDSVKIQQTVFVHRKVMHVIQVTIDKWASRATKKSAEEFVDSFQFL